MNRLQLRARRRRSKGKVAAVVGRLPARARAAAGVACLAATWGLAAAAAGQEAVGGELEPFGPQSSGGRLFNLSLRASAFYDSNAARGTEEIRGLSKSDALFTGDVTIQAVRRLGTFNVFLEGGAGYVEYAKNDDLSNGRVNLQGGVTRRFGRCGASLYDHIQRRQTDLRDLDVRVIRNVQTDNTLGMLVECIPTAGLTASLAGAATTTRNSASGSVPEANVEEASAALGYARPGLGALQVKARYEEIRYRRGARPVRLQPANVTLRGVGLAYSRPIGARLTGRGELTHVEIRSIGRFSGLATKIDFTYRPSPRVTAMIEHQRDISPTLQQGSSFVLNTEWRVQALYKLSPRSQVTVAISENKSRYRDLVIVFPSPTKDRTRALSTALKTMMGRRMEVEVLGAYEERDTNIPAFDYSGYRAGILLSAAL